METRIAMAITEVDQLASKRSGYNRYALAIMLKAAQDCAELVADGATWEDAFSECFTPCRDMHKVAKKVGLKLDVQKGKWILVS